MLSRGGRRLLADRNYLQQADEALTKVLNEKAQEFQETIAPLQQALVTIQQAEQLTNPLNVSPPAGTVNVMPQQPGGAPQGGGMPQVDPAAAGLAGQQAPQQMQARRRHALDATPTPGPGNSEPNTIKSAPGNGVTNGGPMDPGKANKIETQWGGQGVEASRKHSWNDHSDADLINLHRQNKSPGLRNDVAHELWNRADSDSDTYGESDLAGHLEQRGIKRPTKPIDRNASRGRRPFL